MDNEKFQEVCDRARKVMALFIAFRTSVVCNPVFYSDDFFGGKEGAKRTRELMINFTINAMKDEEFRPEKINNYLFS